MYEFIKILIRHKSRGSYKTRSIVKMILEFFQNRTQELSSIIKKMKEGKNTYPSSVAELSFITLGILAILLFVSCLKLKENVSSVICGDDVPVLL